MEAAEENAASFGALWIDRVRLLLPVAEAAREKYNRDCRACRKGWNWQITEADIAANWRRLWIAQQELVWAARQLQFWAMRLARVRGAVEPPVDPVLSELHYVHEYLEESAVEDRNALPESSQVGFPFSREDLSINASGGPLRLAELVGSDEIARWVGLVVAATERLTARGADRLLERQTRSWA